MLARCTCRWFRHRGLLLLLPLLLLLLLLLLRLLRLLRLLGLPSCVTASSGDAQWFCRARGT